MPDDQGRREEVHHVTINTTLYQPTLYTAASNLYKMFLLVMFWTSVLDLSSITPQVILHNHPPAALLEQ